MKEQGYSLLITLLISLAMASLSTLLYSVNFETSTLEQIAIHVPQARANAFNKGLMQLQNKTISNQTTNNGLSCTQSSQKKGKSSQSAQACTYASTSMLDLASIFSSFQTCNSLLSLPEQFGAPTPFRSAQTCTYIEPDKRPPI